MAYRLHSLTSKKATFIWLPEHEEDFIKIKNVLTEKMLVNHFDSRLPVTVLTDASRLHGIGFAMGHLIDGKFHMVVCGSKSLTPTQRRYSTVELECLAIHYAVDKCSFYLRGHPGFQVLTDHRPLVGVFQKEIFELPNPRLQRIREKLAHYSFDVSWVPGKTHYIADALSRAPFFEPVEQEDMEIDTARTCLAARQVRAVSISMSSCSTGSKKGARDRASAI